MTTTLVLVLAFSIGALADHYLESKLRALRAELYAKALAEVEAAKAKAEAVIAEVKAKL